MLVFKDTKRRANPHASYVAEDGTKHLRIPRELLEEVVEPNPPEGYVPEYYIRTEMEVAPYVHYERRPEEQIAEILMLRAKAKRLSDVQNIVVTTTAGNSFDGNEEAQGRMARAAMVMTDADVLPWVLADNTILPVTKAELLEALRQSGMVMGAIWLTPYSV